MTTPRILVVEDEAIVAMDLQSRLIALDYEVVGLAASGEEAIDKAEKTQPDLALMDIRLKGDMDGIEAAQQLRDRFSIPVVYTTAYADEETLRRAKLTEPFGYILKPFEDRELHTVIQMGLYKHSMESRLREMAITDALTGVRNYGYLQDALSRELGRASRSGARLAVILADVDGFKLYNDTYGHLAGDEALKQLAQVLKETCRPYDIVGRYGGDEFMIILPETDVEGALAVAERILERVTQLHLRPDDGDRMVPLSLAVGIAAYPEDGTTGNEIIGYADAAMYESKSGFVGPNKITLAHEQSDDQPITLPSSAFGVLHSLVRAVDRKDHYTRRHSELAAEVAVRLGQALGVSPQCQRALRIAGLLHDVGKLGVPDRVLRKPGSLNADELDSMRQHVAITERMLAGLPDLADVLAAAVNHHERYDGSGYPRGLEGEAIPVLGRILAIADAYSAMIMDRPYRKALSPSEAMAELRQQAGAQFDPQLVELFIGEVLPLLQKEQQAEAA